MKYLYRKTIPFSKRIICIWYDLIDNDVSDISRIQVFSYDENDVVTDIVIDIMSEDITFQQYLTSLMLLKTDGVV